MIKTLKKINLGTLIIFGFNIVVIAAIIFTYFYANEFFVEYITMPVLLIICLVLIVLTILFNWIAMFAVNRRRRKNELLTSEVIGNDIKEAYNYGMIGLVVIDENKNVIWQNEFLTSRNINLLDQPIKNLDGDIDKLIPPIDGTGGPSEALAEETQIIIDDKTYKIKFVAEAGLFIFKDVTENEYLYKKIEDRSPVVGICMIDNYTDLSANREMGNPLLAMVTSAVFEYGKEHGFLVRRYRDDAFILVGDYEHFQLLVEDKFSLLDKVRNLEVEQESPYTLSMGFAYNFPDSIKLNKMAVNAIDLAMNRGGDQVVVSKYGEEHTYYGGASVASAKHNKVKVRLTADTLGSLIKSSSNVVIMGHTNADLDAIGSALGAKAMCDHILEKEAENKGKKFIPSVIVYDQKKVENKTKQAVKASFSREEVDEIFYHPKDLLSGKNSNLIKSTTLLLIVDVARPKMLMEPKLLNRLTKVSIIDHHRMTDDFIAESVFNYIEPSASSTSELITELIQYGNFPEFKFPAKYATIMLAGIYLDTNYFRSNTTGIRTFEAAMVLKEHGADNTLADEFLKDEYEEHALVNKILSTMDTIELGVVVAKSDPKYLVEPATLAKVANKCLQVKGVNAAFVIGAVSSSDSQVSARSDGSVNVQILMEKMGGGGHQAAAAGRFENQSIDEVEERIRETVKFHLSSAKVAEKK